MQERKQRGFRSNVSESASGTQNLSGGAELHLCGRGRPSVMVQVNMDGLGQGEVESSHLMASVFLTSRGKVIN